ncbi:uncharacterized protein NMK_1158 [Novimethylophilus kurashikiensis]|uniref:DUF1456 family protein n=1 Tax=Novimethylophilus kurashikiensis TaxID=1825523 RepID=A0A2R5F5M5_9PROT|nr:DUF1456 family protein [Novimethylophilus kurashikiensis]GBG13607.1 uncharacterized protein NMK_1158 [Novimethylophilus kurashikiensis]
MLTLIPAQQGKPLMALLPPVAHFQSLEPILTNNDVLRSLRYTLDLSEPAMVEIFQLGGFQLPREAVAAVLKKEDEEGYVECDDEAMMHFMDGLVIYKRGPSDHVQEPYHPRKNPLTNNLILKKLRVAFELKEDDMHAILAKAEFEVSKPELSALFRKPGHKNYRACGDQLLRNFLKGLTLQIRG